MRGQDKHCCADAECNSGLRNRYFEGKPLTADAFRVEQRYQLERRHLLNRAVHGWGVVYGYKLVEGKGGEDEGGLTIEPGLALDARGRELLLASPRRLRAKDAIVLDEKGSHVPETDAAVTFRDREACWLLSAHYAERTIDAVQVHDPCSCERDEWNHVCETVRFTLRQVKCATCCDAGTCALTCECSTGLCCSQVDADGHLPPSPRGGCGCLCAHLTGFAPDATRACMVEIDEGCGERVSIDLRHGVPLACVRLEGCDDPSMRIHDACGPRRLVKRNDLLFDLIRGCDLTRISAVGWAEWHRWERPDLVPWNAFRESFGAESATDPGHNVTTRYWVEFTRKVRRETVRPDCFTMSVIDQEKEGGWHETSSVPIVGVFLEGGDALHATRATLVVDTGWVGDAVTGSYSLFKHQEAVVEIQIHGDYILDCNGQAVDANAIGLQAAPTGNGTPGGTYRSNFRVAMRPRGKTDANQNADTGA